MEQRSKTLKMSPNKGSTALADCVLPEELMLCILTRLPVKSIIRFRAVCKPWDDLFSTREFMKMHEGQYSRDPKNQSIIINTYAENMMSFEIESDETKPTILDYPPVEADRMELVGCCNGLICLSTTHLGPGIDIILWNPAMKLYTFTGYSENESFFRNLLSLGFGYDAESDDYKVVRIVCTEEVDDEGEITMGVGVEVYSVSSDSWIIVEPDFKFRVHLEQDSVIVNGNPYWVAELEEKDNVVNGHGDVLVCFDVRKMVFKVVPLHRLNLDSDTEPLTLIDWKGSIGSIVCTRDSDQRTKPLYVLVFDEGDKIWRKVHTFGHIDVDVGRVLECSENMKMLCYKDRRLFVFDPETGRVKFYENEVKPHSVIHPTLYTERLTCIKGMVSKPVKINTVWIMCG